MNVQKQISGKIHKWRGVCAMVVIGSLCSTINAAQIEEYDFESIPAYIPNWGAGYQGVYKPAAGWKSPFRVSLGKEDPHSGMACMKINFGLAAEGVIRVHSPKITIPEAFIGQEVKLVAYVRSESLQSGSISLGILEKDSDQKSLGYLSHDANLIEIEGGANWTQISAEGKLRSNSAAVILMLTASTEAAESTLWIDDILLTAVPIK